MSHPDETTVMGWNEHNDHADDGYDPADYDEAEQGSSPVAEADTTEDGGYSTEPPF